MKSRSRSNTRDVDDDDGGGGGLSEPLLERTSTHLSRPRQGGPPSSNGGGAHFIDDAVSVQYEQQFVCTN